MDAGTWDRDRSGSVKICRLLALCGMLIGSAALAGWILGVALLVTFVPGAPGMAAGTGAGFLLAGASLLAVSWAAQLEESGRRRVLLWASRVGSCAVVAVGALKLTGLAVGRDLGIDTLGFDDLTSAAGPARISPATAFDFVLLGGALYLATTFRLSRMLQLFAFLCALLGWLGCVRYIYGGLPLDPFAQMAVPTACGFILVSCGVLAFRADLAPMRLLMSVGPGGLTIRTLVSAAVVLPVALGWLMLVGEHADWYGPEAGLSLFAVISVAVFAVLTWWNASLIERTDGVRRHAESKMQAQVKRLSLMEQITRAVGERRDLGSIFQVVVATLREQLPADSVCIGIHDTVDQVLCPSAWSRSSDVFGPEWTTEERIPVDDHCLASCLAGQLVYQSDLAEASNPLALRLVGQGLRACVAAPLVLEDRKFGALIVGRRQVDSFLSGECEFLRQLSEHVALAAHQAELQEALQAAYDDLRQTREKVMQQERLSALGQMASGIAHDINNATMPILLYAESLLEKEEGLRESARESVETILRAAADIAQTVSRMQQLYRKPDPSARQATVGLNEIVQQVVELTRVRWRDMARREGSVVQIVTDLFPGLPAIRGSEPELREALTNLVLNALDAMPDGGSLRIQTRCEEDTDNGEQWVAVEVQDSGHGMDDATQRQCLEPFFTTKGEQGTGLGLAMVYAIVQNHEGHCEIASVVGKGTTIGLQFPARTAGGTGEAPGESAETAIPAACRLLLVDDDPSVLRVLTGILETDGHRIVGLDSGAAAVEIFRQAQGDGTPFDIVITDLGMPNMNGRAVSEAVKKISPTTPVILLTGWGRRPGDREDGSPHVDMVLTKPPRLRELRAALFRLLG